MLFEGGVEQSPRGSIGLVRQKNVLHPELSCYQTLELWKTLKSQSDDDASDDIVQLLKDCDLGSKLHSSAGTLSGGQKRKLQLAIGLVGGSKSELPVLSSMIQEIHGECHRAAVVLVDEVSDLGPTRQQVYADDV